MSHLTWLNQTCAHTKHLHNFSQNHIGDEGAAALAQALAQGRRKAPVVPTAYVHSAHTSHRLSFGGCVGRRIRNVFMVMKATQEQVCNCGCATDTLEPTAACCPVVLCLHVSADTKTSAEITETNWRYPLRELDLSHNAVGEAGALALARLLEVGSISSPRWNLQLCAAI